MKVWKLNQKSEIYNNLSNFYPVKIDKKFLLTIKNFNLSFSMKNSDHVDFLASNHIGVYTFKWSSLDDDKFYSLLDVDQQELENIVKNTKGINKEFKVASNKNYIFLVYLMTKTIHSDNNDNIKNELLIELFRTLSYRMISGRITYFFSYNIEENIGHALAEQMTDKFLLKKLGSWNKVIDNKAKDVLEHGYNYKRVCECSTDDIQSVVIDTYNKYNSMIKNMFSLLVDILDKKEITSQSSSFTKDENNEEEYSVANSQVKNSITYVNMHIGSRDIIHPILLKIIAMKTNNDYGNLEQAILKFVNIKDYGLLVTDIISMSIAFINRKGITHRYDRYTDKIITLLKNFYMATSIRTEPMVSVRNKLEKYIDKEVPGKGRSYNKNLATGLFVYITMVTIYK